MLSCHRLSESDFDALAAGLGSASTITALRSAQFSRRLVGLRAVIDISKRTGQSDAPSFSAGAGPP